MRAPEPISYPTSNLVSMRRLEQLLGYERSDLARIAEHAGRYYRPFDRRRERNKGKWRHIDNPTGVLREVQGRIQGKILVGVPLPDTMMGGVRGRSIRDNGVRHTRQSMLVTLDLRDCFPRTDDLQVYMGFRAEVDTDFCLPGRESQACAFFSREECPWHLTPIMNIPSIHRVILN